MRRLLLLPLLLAPLVALLFLAPGGLQAAAWARVAGLLLGLQGLAATHMAAAGALYTLLYAAMILCCVPLAPAMGVAGGALLGAVPGTVCAVAGATLGSFAMVLLARRVLAPNLPARQRAGIERLRPRLERDGFGLVLALRLTILTPSWLVNIAAGLAGIGKLPFLAGTVLGILPATAVFATIGAGLGDALTEPTPPGLGLVLRPAVLIPLVALSLSALLPAALARRRRVCP